MNDIKYLRFNLEEYNAYLKTFYGKKRQELSDMFKKPVERAIKSLC